jgi:hypothetical protein
MYISKHYENSDYWDISVLILKKYLTVFISILFTSALVLSSSLGSVNVASGQPAASPAPEYMTLPAANATISGEQQQQQQQQQLLPFQPLTTTLTNNPPLFPPYLQYPNTNDLYQVPSVTSKTTTTISSTYS